MASLRVRLAIDAARCLALCDGRGAESPEFGAHGLAVEIVSGQQFTEGGRPRTHESDADKQRAYRHRVLGVTNLSAAYSKQSTCRREKCLSRTTLLPDNFPQPEHSKHSNDAHGQPE